ncbi:S-layer homology domain-containing protein [Peptoniphilus indolicus]|uniref:Cellulosome-anchoring protein n=2 Tax=Peptoniphilus indolicus TaxID=33030 RepID=G4D164_9FIRM|nr:S-layer homology domain-containing protein [Peptoniphilus indolicus]EGY80741.1 cellulosome-anchoring protein [Peptoniphilus indolicus ATCC 29427]SUB74847.1 Endo-1,4-beta-xylanase A precursor [Peptoniphilus indolicus]
MKKILILFCFILMLSTPVFAQEISAVLEQPAVAKAVVGDNLNYKLNISIPKEGVKYKSFAVTLLMDEKLSVTGTSLEGVVKNDKIVLKSTEVKGKQNIVSLSVNDMKALGEVNNFSVSISTKVRTGAQEGDFNNSVVLSSIKDDGKESSSQKDLTSNTVVTNSKTQLKINELKTQDEILTGTTQPKAKVSVFDGNIEIENVIANDKGEFEIKIPKQELGKKLKVISVYKLNGKVTTDSENIVVSDSEGKKATVAIDTKVLEDYVKMAMNISTNRASNEDRARIEAAVANAKYVLVMSDRKNSDLEDALTKVKNAVKYLRVPYMNGYWDKTFKPKKEMTRAEVAQVLARVYLKKEPSGNYTNFRDVKQSEWYADAIGFMEEKGFMKGYYDGSFKPEKSITRAEFAAVIAKLKDEGVEESVTYEDVKADSWSREAISYVSSKGYMTGRSSTIFAADYPITRAECAKVLNKILDRSPNKEFMDTYSKNPFKDFDKNDWAYYEILEITGY